jgi:hypothetical protein
VLKIDAENILWKEVEGVVVVLKLTTGDFCEFNDVGSLIWKMIADGHSLAEVEHKIAERYDTSPQRIAADVKGFVDRAVAYGLLRA